MNAILPIFQFRKMESKFNYPHPSLVYQLLHKKVKPQILGQFKPKFLEI